MKILSAGIFAVALFLMAQGEAQATHDVASNTADFVTGEDSRGCRAIVSLKHSFAANLPGTAAVTIDCGNGLIYSGIKEVDWKIKKRWGRMFARVRTDVVVFNEQAFTVKLNLLIVGNKRKEEVHVQPGTGHIATVQPARVLGLIKFEGKNLLRTRPRAKTELIELRLNH